MKFAAANVLLLASCRREAVIFPNVLLCSLERRTGRQLESNRPGNGREESIPYKRREISSELLCMALDAL